MYCPFWMEFSLYDFKITLPSICKFHDNRRGGLHKCIEYLRAYRETDEMYKEKRVLVKHVYCVTQHANNAIYNDQTEKCTSIKKTSEACTWNVIVARSSLHKYRGKAVLHISVYVRAGAPGLMRVPACVRVRRNVGICVYECTQHAERMRHITLSSVASLNPPYFPKLSHKQQDFLGVSYCT